MNLIEVASRTLQLESETLVALKDSYKPEQLKAVFDAIANCKGKVVTSGCGTSAAAARKIAHTLSCVECPAVFMEPSDAVHGGMGMVQRGDVVILLSKGGHTEEINALIAPCRQKGAIVVGVGEDETSPVGSASDLFLEVKIDREPDKFNMLATASILAVIAMFDVISIAYMEHSGFSKKQFAAIHPHGAVGERLLAGE